MKTIRIAVIDTYVNLEHPRFKGRHVKEIHCGAHDFPKVGHATAMCDQILKIEPGAEIDVYPAFGNETEVEPDAVTRAIEMLVRQECRYDILLMSLGFDHVGYIDEIAAQCNAISEMGTVIVSAFDNSGAMSFPAALENVIGVDISEKMERVDDFFVLEHGAVNIVCSNRPRRVADAKGTMLMAGTSISAAFIAGWVAKGVRQGYATMAEALDFLRTHAIRTLNEPFVEIGTFHPDGLRCAAFPYSKEIKSLMNAGALAKCDLVDLYDIRHSSQVGKTVYALESGRAYTVRNIRDIKWDAFDMLVIGHLSQYKRVYKELDPLLRDTILGCKRHGKQVYCLDTYVRSILSEDEEGPIFTPEIVHQNVPLHNNGKLWKTSIPIISIIGTGPRQGKFTSQIKLGASFRSLGYDVGLISTEPTGYLLGADYVFAYGHNSCINLDRTEYPLVINHMVHKLHQKNKDLILTALQSGTIPVNYANISQETSLQQSILYGINADAYILCVYVDDDISLIKRTMAYMESTFQALPLGLLVYPVLHSIGMSGALSSTYVGDTPLYQKQLQRFRDCFEAVYDMNESGYRLLADDIVTRLSA